MRANQLQELRKVFFLSCSQVPRFLLSYYQTYIKQLEKITQYLNSNYPERFFDQIRVDSVNDVKYYDLVADLYKTASTLPFDIGKIEDVNYKDNFFRRYLTHQSMREIDFVLNRRVVDYHLKGKSVRVLIQKELFSLADFFDLIDSYLDFPYDDNLYFTQIQIHNPKVIRFHGDKMIQKSYNHFRLYL
ncbi:MAG: hypothetical protein ACRCXZ_02510 [Patescibacteria group bacterium]